MDKIKKKIKYNVYWFNSKGEIIIKDNDAKNARIKLINKIKKNKIKQDTIYGNIKIDILESYLNANDVGPIKVTIQLFRVHYNRLGLSLPSKDDSYSLYKFYYHKSELNKFKISFIKDLAKKILNKKFKLKPFKLYLYSDILQKLT